MSVPIHSYKKKSSLIIHKYFEYYTVYLDNCYIEYNLSRNVKTNEHELSSISFYSYHDDIYGHESLHRIDGPAYISTTYEEWVQNNRTHREDGPAVIYYNPRSIVWYYDDNEYSFKEWCQVAGVSDELECELRLKYL